MPCVRISFCRAQKNIRIADCLRISPETYSSIINRRYFIPQIKHLSFKNRFQSKMTGCNQLHFFHVYPPVFLPFYITFTDTVLSTLPCKQKNVLWTFLSIYDIRIRGCSACLTAPHPQPLQQYSSICHFPHSGSDQHCFCQIHFCPLRFFLTHFC